MLLSHADMTRHFHILILTNAAALLCAQAGWAQAPTTLQNAEQAAEFCEHALPRGSEDTDEAYHAARRRKAQTPIRVTLQATAAPAVAYDRIAGALRISTGQAATFAAGFAIAADVHTLAFELTEVAAHKLRARYEAGSAAVRVTLLPASWSDDERPLCRKDAESSETVLDGEVLSAQVVDEVGRPLAAMQTPLGLEIARMREHRIRGYLDRGTPVVAVSALRRWSADATALQSERESSLKSRMRTALYGCYVRGLADNRRLQGALVVKVSSTEATVVVDSLHHHATRACALERVTEIGRDIGPHAVKAAIIFRLDESPAL